MEIVPDLVDNNGKTDKSHHFRVSFRVKSFDLMSGIKNQRSKAMGRHGENIRKRKDGRWEGRYKVFSETKGRHYYRSVYGHAYDEVKEKLFKARLGITDHQKITSDSLTLLFSRTAEEWLEEIAGKRKHST